MSEVRISEIFYSIQGESSRVGLPTVFVRLTGCPLRCTYCDTEYAFKGGTKYRIADLLKEVASYKAKYVTVTGGEPLAQKSCIDLIQALCDEGYEVSVETSGAFDIKPIDDRAMVVMDLKTPSSDEMAKNKLDNIEHLRTKDEVKFVMMDRDDYLWSKELIEQYQLASRVQILMSPVWDTLPLAQLSEWVIEDNLPVRFQVQLHKVIWPNEEKGR